MRLLLDTHALLWLLEDNPRLSKGAKAALTQPGVERLVSAVSGFEVCRKHALGKLPGADFLANAFVAIMRDLDCTPLPITLAHAVLAGQLLIAHKDPFDRLLIAQAQLEGVALVSNERLFDGFGVQRLW